MSKRAIRIPSLRAGRPVRLTFEVSADVGKENGAPAKKAPRKRYRAITARRVTQVGMTTSAAQPVASSATSSSAHPAAPARRAVHLQMLAAAMVMICVVTLTLSRRPAPLAAADAADTQPERQRQSSDLALMAQAAVPAAAPAAAADGVAARRRARLALPAVELPRRRHVRHLLVLLEIELIGSLLELGDVGRRLLVGRDGLAHRVGSAGYL